MIREVTPDVPATTNLMVSSATKSMDYFDWAKDLDVVANDHYLVAADPEREIELAFSADLTRGVAGNRPWILMEHSTSAVNWQPRNRPSARRNAPQLPGACGPRCRCGHVLPVAAERSGAEKFHSAMVPHGGRDTRVWREVVALGDALANSGPSRVPRWNPGWLSCSTTRRGGPANWIHTRARM